MRKKIIAGNWKMYKTIAEAVTFFKICATKIKGGFPPSIEVWIAPPFTAIQASSSIVKELGLTIVIGAQNMNEASQGSFTGEISGQMLKEAGAHFCLLGHSERRAIYQESDQRINAKLRRALEQGLRPLLCVGEKEEERSSGEFLHVIENQLASALTGIATEQFSELVLAYEPVWAIGTGKTATPEIAQETHKMIRAFIAKRWGETIAEKLTILYGGSVNVENASVLLQQPDVDGLLIGGASLNPEHFIEITTKVF